MGSRNFEEAYFVLRSDTDDRPATNEKMIEEANKIINENFSSRRNFWYTKRWNIFFFLLGCTVMFLVGLLLALLR